MTRTLNTPLLPVVVLLRPRGNTLLVWHRVGVDVAVVAVVAVVVDPLLLLIALVDVVPCLLTPPSNVPLLSDP